MESLGMESPGMESPGMESLGMESPGMESRQLARANSVKKSPTFAKNLVYVRKRPLFQRKP
jgi:hypothetical protein